MFSFDESDLDQAQGHKTLSSPAIRLLCTLLSASSGAAILAKVYGVGAMHDIALGVFIPSYFILFLVWVLSKKKDIALHDDLRAGYLGGLAGTIGYDLIRLPYHWAGIKVFFPISVYGIWITDASEYSIYTAITGWAYHFSNGVTFGIMYALFMRGRHWKWALAWAFILETIAIVSPFAKIFGLSENYVAIGIAYLGHVAYGLPLAWFTANRKVVIGSRTRALLNYAVIATSLLIVAGLIFPQYYLRRLHEVYMNAGDVSSNIVRISKSEKIIVTNTFEEKVQVSAIQPGYDYTLKPGGMEKIEFTMTGIYYLTFQSDKHFSRGYVIVEPVEELE